jgi:hypothetical protein
VSGSLEPEAWLSPDAGRFLMRPGSAGGLPINREAQKERAGHNRPSRVGPKLDTHKPALLDTNQRSGNAFVNNNIWKTRHVG